MARGVENPVEVANFGAGVNDAPAFGGGGASRMINYIVDPDGEVLPRPSYTIYDGIVHTISGREVSEDRDRSGGRIVNTVNSNGVSRLFKLRVGWDYIVEKDRLFISKESGKGIWLDLSVDEGEEIPGYVWGEDNRPEPLSIIRAGSVGSGASAPDITVELPAGTEYNGGEVSVFLNDRVEYNIFSGEDDTYHITIQKQINPGRPAYRVVYTEEKQLVAGNHFLAWNGVNNDGEREGNGHYTMSIRSSLFSVQADISHPFFTGLTSEPPTPDSPITLRLKVGNSPEDLLVRIEKDDAGNNTPYWNPHAEHGTGNRENRIENAELPSSNIIPGKEFKFTWKGDDTRDPDEIRYITQEDFQDTYLEIVYGSIKRRYYLSGRAGVDVASGIASSVAAGVSVYGLASSIGGSSPIAQGISAGVGGAVALGGTINTLLNKSFEGDVEQIRGARTTLTPAEEDEEGFIPGPFTLIHTYSDTKEKGLETIPSNTSSGIIFDFQNLDEGLRTLQSISIDFPEDREMPDWANVANIYAARHIRFQDESVSPQSTGFDYKLIGQMEYDRDNEEWSSEDFSISATGFVWRDEKVVTPEQFVVTTDHDPPPDGLTRIVSYGSRVWGVNEDDESIVYSKIGSDGYLFFPFDNAFVPQSFELEDNYSKITKIHPAPNDSMLYVFKPDRIHYIRGHGDIRGLHSPNTPIDISIDASLKKENIGTIFPRSITTLKDIVLFLGSDKILYSMSGMSIQPFSLGIQPVIEQYTDEELAGTVAFEYRNCYHLCLPDEMLVLDLQKKYWTMFDWEVRDVFWAQDTGDGNQENTFYAVLSDDTIVQLFEDWNGDEEFNCEYITNPMKLPYETVISGIHVYHDGSSKGELTVGVKVDNAAEFTEKTYRPSKRNRYRQGFHAKGQRIQILVRDENPPDQKLRIDRVAVETTPY